MTVTLSGKRPAACVAGYNAALIVAPTPDGHWLVRDRRRGLERRFATQRAALHFALFEIGGPLGSGAVLGIPPASSGRI